MGADGGGGGRASRLRRVGGERLLPPRDCRVEAEEEVTDLYS